MISNSISLVHLLCPAFTAMPAKAGQHEHARAVLAMACIARPTPKRQVGSPMMVNASQGRRRLASAQNCGTLDIAWLHSSLRATKSGCGMSALLMVAGLSASPRAPRGADCQAAHRARQPPRGNASARASNWMLWHVCPARCTVTSWASYSW